MSERKMGRPRKGDAAPSEVAKEWFRARGLGADLTTCAKECGISLPTARKGRELWRNAAMLDPVAGSQRASTAGNGDSPHTSLASLPSGAVPRPATLSSRTLRQLEGDVEETFAAMTPDQALAAATSLYRTADNENVRLAALKVIMRSGDQADSARLGPGAPLSLADRLHRGALVLAACLRENAEEVWRLAFNETINGTTKLPEPEVVDDIPAPAIPELVVDPIAKEVPIETSPSELSGV